MQRWTLFIFDLMLCWLSLVAQTPANAADKLACRVESVEYQGWQAQQISNAWVKLIVVPQNGGRLMQVIFGGHSYLFVHPQYAGKYFPPTQGKWFNYGGDKLWPLPEGTRDEQHGAGGSDVLDDGPYSSENTSQAGECAISLAGPADPGTGLQFLRTISLGSNSPQIHFHALMKNSTGPPIEWSVQSVSQYDTTDPKDASRYNRDFRAFTPANLRRRYLDRYHVRFGPAENPGRAEGPGIKRTGSFGVFFSGRLGAPIYDRGGRLLDNLPLSAVDPLQLADIEKNLAVPAQAARLSLHVEDSMGIDRGSLGEAVVEPAEENP